LHTRHDGPPPPAGNCSSRNTAHPIQPTKTTMTQTCCPRADSLPLIHHRESGFMSHCVAGASAVGPKSNRCHCALFLTCPSKTRANAPWPAPGSQRLDSFTIGIALPRANNARVHPTFRRQSFGWPACRGMQRCNQVFRKGDGVRPGIPHPAVRTLDLSPIFAAAPLS
jgi:hypothetical protein